MTEKRKRMEKRGVNPHRTTWKRKPHQKKKWVDHPVYVGVGVEKYVNPVRKRSNGEVRSPVGGNRRKGGALSPRRRRKQERRQKRVDRRSLRWRYGGERGDQWRRGREHTGKQREKKQKAEMKVCGWVKVAPDARVTRAEDRAGAAHRRRRQERRVEVRRWRSGRVDTVARAQERVEKGKVRKRHRSSERTVVASGRERRHPGEGRQREPGTWKKRKGGRASRRGDGHHAATGVPYAQRDYVAGRRILVRRPKSDEVRVAKGTTVSKYR